MRNTYEKMASQTWPNGRRKVAKWEEAGQEALVKSFWVKNWKNWFKRVVHAWAVPIIPNFTYPHSFLAVKMTFEVKIPLF